MRSMFVPVPMGWPSPEDRSGSRERAWRRRLRATVARLLRPRRVPARWTAPVLEDAEWYVAAAVCSEALRRWESAGPMDRADAYAAYRAALEREEAAARELARAASRRYLTLPELDGAAGRTRPNVPADERRLSEMRN